jgi:Cys-tRNA(Pro)/Cys-tRNA(Cys) deacylase
MTLPAHQFLDRLEIPYQTRQFPPSTEKGAANVARALGCREGQMVKTLIFEVDTGEQVLVMLGGDKNAVSGHLKQAIGSRNIRLAAPDTVKSVTGYEIGSIPPFHWQPAGFRTFMDAALLEEEFLGVGAGLWGSEIIMKPADVARACAAAVVNLSDRSRPAL